MMPYMDKRPSGGIVFRMTKQEREIHDMKRNLKNQIDEVEKLKHQLYDIVKKHQEPKE